MVRCTWCKDQFDPVENADLDTPFCCWEHEYLYWSQEAFQKTYNEGRNSGAPLF